MSILNDVSETAIITLKSRVIESQKKNPIFYDEMSFGVLEKVKMLLAEEGQHEFVDRKLPTSLTRHIALRARKYDQYTLAFLDKHPDGLVVNLGCGFDTRFWRMAFVRSNQFVELDLPNVIKTKKEILNEKIDYLTIAGSVLEDDWINAVLDIANKEVLFLAEGLFMYLPQQEVEQLFNKLSELFSNSYIVFETVNKKYTQGIWKKMVESKMKRSLGTKAGSAYQFGVNEAKEIEKFGKTIKVVDEWSYFEDPEIQPKVLYYFRNLKFFTRTQWTIKAAIG